MATTGKLIVILAMPRSGSHFLRSALARGGAVDNLDETFNPDLAARPHSFVRFLRSEIAKNPDFRFDHETAERLLADYFDGLEELAADRPLLLDIKDEQLRLLDWPATNPGRAPRLLSHILQRGYPVLRLVRHDLLSQYASHLLAQQTRQWVLRKGRKPKAPAATITLEPRRTARHIREMLASDAMIRRWLTTYPKTARLVYEHAIENDALTGRAIAAIAKATGIRLEPGTAGETKKIAPPLRDYVSNLDAILDGFTDGNLGWLRRLHAGPGATGTKPQPSPRARPAARPARTAAAAQAARPRQPANGAAPVPVILTNYKRPQNLPRLVGTCLASKNCESVIVIDNAPDDSLRASLDFSSGRVDYRPNLGNRGAGYRFAVAARLDRPLVVAIDDDLFPTVQQIDRLIAAARADPGRLHGIWGERLTTRDNHPHFANAIHNENRDIDIVNRVYVFDPLQAAKACSMMRQVGFRDWHDAMPSDDVFLSFASDRKPRMHDLGPIEECPTSGAEGIAQWRREDFIQRRWQVVAKLHRIRPARRLPWLTEMIRTMRGQAAASGSAN